MYEVQTVASEADFVSVAINVISRNRLIEVALAVISPYVQIKIAISLMAYVVTLLSQQLFGQYWALTFLWQVLMKRFYINSLHSFSEVCIEYYAQTFFGQAFNHFFYLDRKSISRTSGLFLRTVPISAEDFL